MNRSDLKRTVLLRDGACVLSILDRLHVCRDTFGVPHGPSELRLLTLEHVREHAAMGGKKVDDPRWCVALCAFYNGPNVVTADQKQAFREYLAEKYPDA